MAGDFACSARYDKLLLVLVCFFLGFGIFGDGLRMLCSSVLLLQHALAGHLRMSVVTALVTALIPHWFC